MCIYDAFYFVTIDDMQPILEALFRLILDKWENFFVISNCSEPSAAEKLAMSSAIGKQTAAQKLLASKYCTLILGLGTQEQHHMACGK